ncbi:MAG: 16S rRNA (adenine(1518)-N(6)/adenine(1519)-N(6))-dimethyltransferase RsmA [Oscillospiraceae bacterium]|nr:16S rRNA (adenine(1518)-N(6)/adenine(1519)-N(6))-dimethyltransferase RsmA [Oscillospiraceae bacterium]
MSQLSNIKTVREILSRHGFTFSKKLGQNFIINPSVCPRIAQMGGAGPDAGVLEVGPGLGVLTWELAARAKKVVAIELDERLLPVLGETLAEFDNVTVLQGDVLKIDLAALIQREFSGMEVVVCANLPYYITSPILMGLLEARLPVRSITVMVQKEAAARICAEPGSKNAGALSAAVHYYAQPQVLFSVSRGSFMPAPEVDSSVIRLDVRPHPAVSPQDETLFFKVIRAGFSQRRKTLANSLSSGLALPKEQAIAALAGAQIRPNARAEELTLEDFCRLASQIFEEDFDKKV